jgi:hypothetical protein
VLAVCHLQVLPRKAEVPTPPLLGYNHYELTDYGFYIFAPFGKGGWVYVAAVGLVCLRRGQ